MMFLYKFKPMFIVILTEFQFFRLRSCGQSSVFFYSGLQVTKMTNDKKFRANAVSFLI